MHDSVEILRGVRLINPASTFDGIVDVAIGKNTVQWIRDTAEEPSGLWLLPGLVDMHVHLRTPGNAEAETLETGLRAAVAGGITCVGMMPNTTPPLDSPEIAMSVKSTGETLGLARIVPIPCVTVNRSGKVCTDLELFALEGITCFSDDGSPVETDEALVQAFSRVSAFNGVVIEHPELTALASGGVVNLGLASKATGARGIPESAEFLDVQRCIDLLQRSGSIARLHLTHLSSPESIRLAHKAAGGGLRVTCDVTPHHLTLDESSVINMGAIAKMNPPLRSAESRIMLVDMVRRGMVTAVASDHAPHHSSRKQLPLSEAASGITGLETLLPLTLEVLGGQGGMKPMDIIRLLTTAPAEILNTELPDISQGKQADMILFNPDFHWIYSNTFSKSTNSPFFGKRLTGKVLRVWLGREIYRDGEFV
jgi:dihydroorotase